MDVLFNLTSTGYGLLAAAVLCGFAALYTVMARTARKRQEEE
ncbi:MAG: hypothetical protein QNJ35_11410 [Paracoccaceae bacterium]|nr:hypothetical protein [Paracoccaceae bacterium]